MKRNLTLRTQTILSALENNGYCGEIQYFDLKELAKEFESDACFMLYLIKEYGVIYCHLPKIYQNSVDFLKHAFAVKPELITQIYTNNKDVYYKLIQVIDEKVLLQLLKNKTVDKKILHKIVKDKQITINK